MGGLMYGGSFEMPAKEVVNQRENTGLVKAYMMGVVLMVVGILGNMGKSLMGSSNHQLTLGFWTLYGLGVLLMAIIVYNVIMKPNTGGGE